MQLVVIEVEDNTVNRRRTVVSGTWKYDDPPAVENATRGRAAHVPRTTVRHMFCRTTKNKQNVNKNNAEYILRLHLVNVTSRDRFTVTRDDIIMSPRVTVKR